MKLPDEPKRYHGNYIALWIWAFTIGLILYVAVGYGQGYA